MKDLEVVLLNTIGRAKRLGKVGFLPGPFKDIGGEIRVLGDRVNEVALGREQVQILVAAFEKERAEPGMKLAVQLAVVRAVLGVLEFVATVDGKRVAGGVEVMQIVARLGRLRAGGGGPGRREPEQRLARYVALG